jgi:hypothetical protein
MVLLLGELRGLLLPAFLEFFDPLWQELYDLKTDRKVARANWEK